MLHFIFHWKKNVLNFVFPFGVFILRAEFAENMMKFEKLCIGVFAFFLEAAINL